jgi:hypothetical protein
LQPEIREQEVSTIQKLISYNVVVRDIEITAEAKWFFLSGIVFTAARAEVIELSDRFNYPVFSGSNLVQKKISMISPEWSPSGMNPGSATRIRIGRKS